MQADAAPPAKQPKAPKQPANAVAKVIEVPPPPTRTLRLDRASFFEPAIPRERRRSAGGETTWSPEGGAVDFEVEVIPGVGIERDGVIVPWGNVSSIRRAAR